MCSMCSALKKKKKINFHVFYPLHMFVCECIQVVNQHSVPNIRVTGYIVLKFITTEVKNSLQIFVLRVINKTRGI